MLSLSPPEVVLPQAKVQCRARAFQRPANGVSGLRTDGAKDGDHMNRRHIILGLAALPVAGCGRIRESRFNPFNWFGRDRNTTVVVGERADIDPRPLVDQVLSMSVEQAQGGAIIRATGLPPTQGYWDAELLDDSRTAGVLTYQFRLQRPLTPQRTSTTWSREVEVATFVTDQELQGIREIQVLGARASRAARR